MRNKLLRGIEASPGIIIGRAIINEENIPSSIGKDDSSVADKLKKFNLALNKTREDIIEMRNIVLEKGNFSHVRIFDAHLMVLEDKTLIEGVVNKIKLGNSVESALQSTLEDIKSSFVNIKDEYIKSKLDDIKDVVNRILSNLILTTKGEESRIYNTTPLDTTGYIYVSKELYPSDLLRYYKMGMRGFATQFGTKDSHSSIIGRSLRIPGVVGLKELTNYVKEGDTLLIDGNMGLIIINPEEDVLRTYEKKIIKFQKYEDELKSLINLSSETIDGYSIILSCNINLPEEVDLVINSGAKGIGLLRTDFFDPIDFDIYKNIVEKIYPESVIIRTLDLGADKFLPEIKENNPFLGWRGIRFSLSNSHLFRAQLKNILKASYKRNVKIMFPMVTCIDEILQIKAHIQTIKEELNKEGVEYDKDIEIGVMVEVPSIALISEAVAKEVDFLSIGTNDLTQYTLACDRTNPYITDIYNNFNPAVVNLINKIIENGHSQRKWVNCCGELASHPLGVILLIGMGIDELSVNLGSVLSVKKIIRAVSMSECKSITDKALGINTVKDMDLFLQDIKNKFNVIKEELDARSVN